MSATVSTTASRDIGSPASLKSLSAESEQAEPSYAINILEGFFIFPLLVPKLQSSLNAGIT
jgi:hypothetical protein